MQSQVPIRQPPLGWPNWRNEIFTSTKNKSLNTNDKIAENTSDKMLKTKPQEEKGHERIQIVDTVSISKEAFEVIK